MTAPPLLGDCAPGRAPAPVRRTLQVVAAELGGLAALGDRLQEAIGEVLEAADEVDGVRLMEMQQIDLLVQNLRGLGDFVQAMADLSSPVWVLDVGEAAARTPLKDLAQRLGGACVSARPPLSADGGDLELFG